MISTERWTLNVGGHADEKPILNDKRAAGAKKNVAKKHPNVVKRMLREHVRMLKSVDTPADKLALVEEKLS